MEGNDMNTDRRREELCDLQTGCSAGAVQTPLIIRLWHNLTCKCDAFFSEASSTFQAFIFVTSMSADKKVVNSIIRFHNFKKYEQAVNEISLENWGVFCIKQLVYMCSMFQRLYNVLLTYIHVKNWLALVSSNACLSVTRLTLSL